MPALYGDYLGMTPVFGRATSRDGKGEYGVMALAEYKIEFVDKLLLPTPAGYEQRICLMTKVYAPIPFHFLVTHFLHPERISGAREHRVAAIQMITDKINERKLYPAVLCRRSERGTRNTGDRFPAYPGMSATIRRNRAYGRIIPGQ